MLVNPFDPMSPEPVPPAPLSDLLTTSLGPTPLPSFELPEWLRTPFQLSTQSPLTDLLKTSLEPTPLPPFELPELLGTPPQLPTQLPLTDLLKTSLTLSSPAPLLSDLLKTSFEPTPLPPFTVDSLPTLSKDIASSPFTDYLPPNIDSLPGLPQFSVFDSTKVGPFPPLTEMLTKPHDSLKLVLRNLDSILPPIESVEASRLTHLTGALMSDWANTVGSINPSKVSPLLQDFHQASSNYSAFLSSIPAGVLDPLSLRLPARGYFESADALMEIDQGPGFDLKLHRQRELTRTNLETRTRATIEAALAKINPSLCKLWHGANLAAISDNPDKARHALTSLRELFTQVIHHLAPDAKVKKWTSDPAKYHNGRPTREARLLFICSPVATPPMSDFIEADVRSVLSLAQVFQQGTHDIDLSLSPSQLRLIFLRVEGALCALIETGLPGF